MVVPPDTASMLRPGKPDDAVAIARIHVETWQNTYAGVLPDAYLVGMNLTRRAANWNEVLRREQREQSVMVCDLPQFGVVGFASCGPARTAGLGPRFGSHGEVYTLYVAPDFQGQGHGRSLLNGMLDILRSRRHDGAVLWVLAANPSRFFYEAMGGTRVAERTEQFAGAELLEIAYAWTLSSS